MNSPWQEEYFGSDAQIAVLKRGRALFDLLHGDGRFSCHGRAVGLIRPKLKSRELIVHLAHLQGATHYMLIRSDEIEGVLSDAAQDELQTTHYARWEIGLEAASDTARRTSEITLPKDIQIIRMTPDTAPNIVADFARMSLACGVLPAWRSAHMGQSLKSRTLLAVTTSGKVVSSAYASSYMTDTSERACNDCFWGMLATHPDWRRHGLSLALGGRLFEQMHADFGFTSFYTGVQPGNAASEAVCHKLGLRTQGNSIVTIADASQLPGGRMSK